MPPKENRSLTSRDADEAWSEELALRRIVEGIEAETGAGFFPSLVRHVARTLDVDYAFVSELLAEKNAFRTLAVWGRGEPLPNIEIPLLGTPCEAVLRGEMAHHPESLQTKFPADLGLQRWGVESYCGVPLLDSSGTVVGHLAIFDSRPMWDPRGLSILRIFAARTAAEIERLRTEERLRQSEARFRDLYEEAPVAYITVGVDGTIQSINRRAVEIYGYRPEQSVGQSVFRYVADTPAGQAKAAQLFARFLDGQEVNDEEVEGIRADGERIWIQVSARAIRDAAGIVQAARATLVDVTDRRIAEERRRETEERLARIVDSAMDAIVTFDERLSIEIFNEAAEKVFVCSAANAIGTSFERFLTTRFREGLERSLRGFEAGQPAEGYVWAPGGLAARRGDGREFPIDATVSRVEVAGRKLFTLIIRDLDERRQVEEELRQLSRQNEYLQEELRAVHNVDEIVGQSPAIAAVLENVRLVAGTDSSVLILGETGTGKELIARAVHSNGSRRNRPLIKVNCAALPVGLMESELFGHEKGAFTGAGERRIGRFELADGGTIFLDEIGEMPLDVQVKLLRVLQEREFERVGGSKTIRVDVRLIAATNRDLQRAVAEGKFRQDLFYRLNVFPVRIPPLRDRPEDVPLLVHYFVARFVAKIGRRIARVPKDVMRRLCAYSWPGNVRELENVIERAVILSPGSELVLGGETLAAALPVAPRPVVRAEAPPSSNPQTGSLEDIERGHIVTVLRECGWRIEGARGAAAILGLNPSTLRSRMKKLGVRRSVEDSVF